MQYERKEKERKMANRPKFRHGKDTLKFRITKKLTESTTWFKNIKNRNKLDIKDIEKGKVKEKRWRNQNEKLSDSPQAVSVICTLY